MKDLKQLNFHSTNDLIVEIYQNEKETYEKIHNEIYLIRNCNEMLEIVTDEQVKNIIEKKRKELIKYVLFYLKPKREDHTINSRLLPKNEI